MEMKYLISFVNGVLPLLIAVVAILIYWRFNREEGKDERGRLIYYKSMQVNFTVFLCCLALAFSADNWLPVPDGFFRRAVTWSLLISLLAGSISVFVYRKKY